MYHLLIILHTLLDNFSYYSPDDKAYTCAASAAYPRNIELIRLVTAHERYQSRTGVTKENVNKLALSTTNLKMNLKAPNPFFNIS